MANKNTKEKVRISKERFISDFCKERGWNPKELTTGQMLFIVSQPGYKSLG